MTSSGTLFFDDTCAPVECGRAAARRAQILDAAAECFRSCGFHGASIASISQLAGMSAGHIYHYFENKEAIIAAIVQRDLERIVTLWAELRSSHDIRETMVALSSEGVFKTMDTSAAGLNIEIIAEAARNPEVARIVRAADCCCMASLIQTLRIARQEGGKHDDEATLVDIAEITAAMFEGLMVRAIRNPTLDHRRMAAMMQRVMRQIIASPDWEATPQEAPPPLHTHRK
ncbi:MAG: TetR/AcrR family transcriptional regulator [Azoarcus sp.]|jgi:AcrR family transcriptional regulator|nr:TetR/AcrR family transcriptional regulator [Azoarcus sp.]